MAKELTDEDIRKLMDEIETMPATASHRDVMRKIAKALGLIE